MRKASGGRILIGLSFLLVLASCATTPQTEDAAPVVSLIAFVSSPARGDTYERGETVELTVQFDRVVRATGEAQLALTIGTETRHATALGVGNTSRLFFDYTVREGDHDEDGISISANALALAGGTIKAPDGTTDADLTHVAVAADGGRKVDGSLVSPPMVQRYLMSLPPPRDGTYELGETVQVTIEFDKPVTVTGSPQVALTIGEQTRYATYLTSWGDDRYALFSYTVQESDRDGDGISISANSLLLNDGTIRSVDGLTDADLAHAAVAARRDRKVDGGREVTPARVRDIHFRSSPTRGDTYELGETVEVHVEFDKAVTVTGTPGLALTIGTRTRHATWFAQGGRHSLYFGYTVQAGDRDDDGISIPANALALNGGTITAPDGTTEAVLTHEAMASDGAGKVNASDVTPPLVTAIGFRYSTPARGDTYELGETVEVEVEFDKEVTATGDPQVALTIGTETRHAALIRFSGGSSQSLRFRYTVQEADRDDDGISVPANALTLNGGTITAADGRTDADLTHGTVPTDGDRKVNGSLTTPPEVRIVYFISLPARDATYELGETIELLVVFDRAVTVIGSPQVALTIGTQTRYATFNGWGNRSLFFAYTVQEADRDEDGISIAANSLSLNGGTIKAAYDATTDADLTHGAVAAYDARKVNGGRATP